MVTKDAEEQAEASAVADQSVGQTPVGKLGRPAAIAAKIKAGDKLVTDGCFSCMPGNERKTVKRDPERTGFHALYVSCRGGKHYLEGQLDERGELVGFFCR